MIDLRVALLAVLVTGWSCLCGAQPSQPAAVRPVQGLPAELVDRLNHPDYQQRQTAQADLLQWSLARPAQAREQLLQLMQDSPHPEQRLRSLEVLRVLHAASYGSEGQGFIGITMQEQEVRAPGRDGFQPAVRVSMLLEGHAAAKAGIQIGDDIVMLNGRWLEKEAGAPPQRVQRGFVMPATPIIDPFKAQVSAMKPGTVVRLGILRHDKIEQVEVTLGRRPAIADRQGFGMDPKDIEQAEKEEMEEDFRRWLKASLNKGG